MEENFSKPKKKRIQRRPRKKRGADLLPTDGVRVSLAPTHTTVGRPRKEWDADQFIRLCQIQCVKDEICHCFGIEYSTLERRCEETFGKNFDACYKEYSADGRRSLRRRLYEAAMRTDRDNNTIMIWLSKQYLGMRDQPEGDIIDVTPVIIEGFDGTTVTLTTERVKNEQPTPDSDTVRDGDFHEG